MRRKTLDLLATAGGAMLTIVLVVAGVLGVWAYNWSTTNVRNQLTEQKIQMPTLAELATAKNPAPGGFSEVTPAMVPYLKPYAGQWMTTGAQAEAYADHFIGIHIQEIGGGLTYSEASAKAMALPRGSAAYTAAEATVQTIFQGTTLRGLLLEAYGFSKFGQIALVGAIVAFVLAGVMLIFTLFGVWHYSRTREDVEFPKSLHHEERVPAGV